MIFVESVAIATVIFTPKTQLRDRMDIMAKLYAIEDFRVEVIGKSTYKIYKIKKDEDSLAKK